MSGRPGNDFPCSRYLKPSAKMIFLTRISGFVSLDRMRDIRLLRSVLLIVSTGHNSQTKLIVI
jgi:hypothetical protein